MNEIIKKNGITYGLISGLFSVAATTLIYTVNLNLFTSIWVGVLMFFIHIGITISLLSKTKKDINGLFTFKDAFTTYFICAVIGILISVLFNIILFNYIDPGVKETTKDLTLKSMKIMFEKFNTPADAINTALKTINETDQFSIGSLIKGSMTSILISSIFGLILAAIFKTKTIQND